MESDREVDIVLIDGSRLHGEVGDLHYEYEGTSGMAPVTFGEEGEEPLPGAATIKSPGVALNPLKRKLYPIQLRHL